MAASTARPCPPRAAASRTREHLRGLLVAHSILARRDELVARYPHRSRQALALLEDPDHRDIIEPFVRWHMLRRMNQMDTVRSARTP